MITGFNHNIKYKNRIYHVQTEDSGLKNPHIITHLFVGGNIIATKKADYTHLVASTPPEKLGDAIRAMMEEQHKTLLRTLIHGKFDNALNAENAHHLDGPAPLNVSAEVLAQTGGSGNKTSAPAPAPPTMPRPMPAVFPPSTAARTSAPAPLDLAAAAAASIMGGTPAPSPRPTPVAMPAPVSLPAESSLAPEVLAARALKEKPAEKPVSPADTIFGEDLISEKSLDEVILSYLADELE